MTCPICDHTMQRIVADIPTFWCPRCGTLTALPTAEHTDTDVPRLVERCRKFEPQIDFQHLRELWHRVGIEEAIHVPNEGEDL